MRKNRTSGSHADVNFPTLWNPLNLYRRGTAESSGMAFRFGRNATAPRVTKRFGLWWTAFLWKMSWNVDGKRLRSKIKGPSHMKRLTTLGCKWLKDKSEKKWSLLICQSLETCLVHYVQLSLNQNVGPELDGGRVWGCIESKQIIKKSDLTAPLAKKLWIKTCFTKFNRY